MKSVYVAFIPVLLIGFQKAEASSPQLWNATGATCIASDTAMQFNGYADFNGMAIHNSSATGTMTFYCPLNLQDGFVVHSFNLMFQNLDSGGRVTASLVRMGRTDGLISNIVTLDTNLYPFGLLYKEQPISYTLNWQPYVYYVRVDLMRSTTTSQPIFVSVGVE